MKKKLLLIFLVSSFFNSTISGPRFEFDQTTLDTYVHSQDESYKYHIVKTIKHENSTSLIIKLISQTFLTKKDVDRTKWKHWLVVVIPEEIKHQTAMLIIGGGDNDKKIPEGPSGMSYQYAKATGSVVVELGMVPNQPLTFLGENEARWEDALIAYTWDKYLKTGEDRWPARMAMTKSAIAAMDAVQEIMSDQEVPKIISKFVDPVNP